MRHMIILINLVIAYFYYMQRRANVKSQGKKFIFTSKYTFPPDMRSRAPLFSGKAGNKKAVLPKQSCRKGSSGLRLPASASCLGRHSRLAGRGPNSSSLFPPQAAVVAVALAELKCAKLCR